MGYGFTWKGDSSNTTTCISPTCNTTGCSPSFGASALCAAGSVTADTSYNSVVGVGFNLNQTTAAGATPGNHAAPATVTVTTVLSGAGTGNAAMRVQLTDSAGTSWCVDSGTWASGVAIAIGLFNTKCWAPTTGTFLTAGTNIVAVHVVIPGDATVDRPFSFCLTGATL